MKFSHMFKLAALLVSLVAFAAAAQAQIAAPRLNDVQLNTLEVFNAAVLPWHQTTIVGANIINDLTVEADLGGSTVEGGSGDGNGLYLRVAGPTFAFAAETSTLEIEAVPPFAPPGGETVKIKNNLLALASKLGDSFTVSFQIDGEEFSSSSAGGTNTQKNSAPTFGGTWKISNAFYLGGTYGKEKLDFEGGGGTASGDRTVGRIGAAFYNRTDTSGFHVEVYKEDAGLAEVRDAADTLVYAEQGESTGFTLEFVGANFLFGFESIKTTTDELSPFNVPPLRTVDETSKTITLGYTPKTGFAITLAKLDVEQTESDSPGVTIGIGATVLGLAWKF